MAVVTGGASGIGRATVERFAAEGCRVAVWDLAAEEGAALVAELGARHGPGRAQFARVDVSREADVQAAVAAAVAQFGRVDVLVNSAAVFDFGSVDAASAEAWARTLAVNVGGTANCCRHVVRHMKERGGGAIVNVASISSFVGQANFAPYATSKAAILGMTRNIARDGAPLGIRANSVAPGTIDTPATRRAAASFGVAWDDMVAAENKLHMLGRIGLAAEVASAIVFLASSDASFITATNLMVDGGYTAM